MKPGLVRLVTLSALVAVIVGFILWWTSDRRRISAQFEALQNAIEKAGSEGTLDRVSHARAASDLFAEGFVILAQPYEGTIEDLSLIHISEPTRPY